MTFQYFLHGSFQLWKLLWGKCWQFEIKRYFFDQLWIKVCLFKRQSRKRRESEILSVQITATSRVGLGTWSLEIHHDLYLVSNSLYTWAVFLPTSQPPSGRAGLELEVGQPGLKPVLVEWQYHSLTHCMSWVLTVRALVIIGYCVYY